MNRPFDALDHDGQVERLDHLAREALDAFSMEAASASLHAYTNNAVYEVIDRAGAYLNDARYALRISRPGNKRAEWIRSELMWLSAIRRRTALQVPEPASHLHEGRLSGVEGPVYCALFGWISGETVEAEGISLERVRAIGAFAAELHHLSATLELPDEFVRPRLDWDGLFGDDSPYRSGGEADYFSDDQREIIDQAAGMVAEVMAGIGPGREEFGLIHGDLLPKNILFQDDEVCALDFDDCAFGFYVYDLSPMLWRLRDDPRYVDIKAALWDGYVSARPLGAAHREALEAFLCARHIASCRWIAGVASRPEYRGRARDIISERVDELKQFLAHGVLR